MPTPEENKAVFDEEELLARLMGDRELGQAVIFGFLEDIPQQIDTLKHRLGEGDAPLVSRQHTRSKARRQPSVPQALREVAYTMEQAGKAGELQLRSRDWFPGLSRNSTISRSPLQNS